VTAPGFCVSITLPVAATTIVRCSINRHNLSARPVDACMISWTRSHRAHMIPQDINNCINRTEMHVHSVPNKLTHPIHLMPFFPRTVAVFTRCFYFHSFSSLSYDRSKASSKANSLHSAIRSFLLQMRVSSPFLKVIQ